MAGTMALKPSGRESANCRKESTRRLRELYSQAVPRGAALIGSYVRYLAGEEELGKLYDYTFGSRPGEKEDAQ